MEDFFSKWIQINNHDDIMKKEELKRAGYYVPGIYAIAYSSDNLSGIDFDYIEDIVYFGMSINKRGLQGRLYQFFSAINGKSNRHSGAEKMYRVLPTEDINWKDKLYISLWRCIYCNVIEFSPKDLSIMGDIAKQEYICLSEYMKRYNKLPRFCNKPKSI